MYDKLYLSDYLESQSATNVTIQFLGVWLFEDTFENAQSKTNAVIATTYSRAGNLRTYLKSHSGEKLNKCNQCDFASSETGNLRRHLKTHSGEKSNKCNQCDFACSDPSSLSQHLKTHSGKKSSKCSQCDYSSCETDNLKMHLEMHKEFKSILDRITCSVHWLIGWAESGKNLF